MTVKLTTFIVITSILLGTNIYSGVKLQELAQEKVVYNWRFFTCRTLLDDPATRQIMDVKWKRQQLPQCRKVIEAIQHTQGGK